ncbi:MULTISPECIES: tRNA (adenine(22)-N(1))-methyltransferase [Brevibacillus]|jgi:tRNA (adenine22-N1)-methyltransferase|uniref:tRNA (Adenine-N(1)-)-methyltransferase n=1 Tax=Brevibacillus borstelensis AK1 TaxID=1300222 RepID=M8DBI8_9BACL|nr:tRNA (adenine(22)-N(1))-methyltransferase TrmK [Brevibacillus borstelensis]EMT50717.1 tRNA (adenine-N(1)-)-methyltransferase [Brevibacillus borstelensis AK1]KKX55961.1 SAM-dependent methyltransferase [Brevibacillus borstelensis cifa_chp40]MBE5396789.1 tRNA (adenine-N(1))-methyltransferase [Brevibacillus borstelensis]MCC0564527.1 tRNA (adenine(22)-N(1))-methyltransferase TrmK [Brevibacillus borstelensis]MCM3471119.1 tRNA (adenine(22)-N(1))-methyltransferase TrmK [Brevibacillus borstelensis]
MTTWMISRRLQTIARFCPKGARVADIGSDHALLASYLIREEIASFVVAGELNEGPYQAALKQIHTIQAEDKASVRKGDGLSVLKPGEVDVVCIAGMGGQLIVSILSAGADKLEGVSRLILQPNVGEEHVRRWFVENNWQLSAETIMEEDGIIYEILVADKGDGMIPYRNKDRSPEELLRIGPFLWEEKSPVLAKKWMSEREKWTKVLEQLSRSDKQEAAVRAAQIKEELEWINEVIACLPTDKP